MSFDLDETLEMLQRTPAVLAQLLRGTKASWHAINEGAETWSAIDILGHLIHGEETDWLPRARIILEGDASQVFAPYDRFAQFERFKGWSLDQLLDRLAELREVNIETVRAWRLDVTQLALKARHPQLGVVTLRELLSTWVAHDLNHLAQVSRVMAKRYSEDVGPWREFLTILHR